MEEYNVRELSDNLLEQVVGGVAVAASYKDYHTEEEGGCTCPICGRPATKVTHNGEVWGECAMHSIFSL